MVLNTSKSITAFNFFVATFWGPNDFTTPKKRELFFFKKNQQQLFFFEKETREVLLYSFQPDVWMQSVIDASQNGGDLEVHWRINVDFGLRGILGGGDRWRMGIQTKTNKPKLILALITNFNSLIYFCDLKFSVFFKKIFSYHL